MHNIADQARLFTVACIRNVGPSFSLIHWHINNGKFLDLFRSLFWKADHGNKFGFQVVVVMRADAQRVSFSVIVNDCDYVPLVPDVFE